MTSVVFWCVCRLLWSHQWEGLSPQLLPWDDYSIFSLPYLSQAIPGSIHSVGLCEVWLGSSGWVFCSLLIHMYCVFCGPKSFVWASNVHMQKASFINRGILGRKVICSALEIPSGVLHPGLASPAWEGFGAVGINPKRAMKMLTGLEHTACEGSWACSAWRRLRGGIPVF